MLPNHNAGCPDMPAMSRKESIVTFPVDAGISTLSLKSDYCFSMSNVQRSPSIYRFASGLNDNLHMLLKQSATLKEGCSDSALSYEA